MLLSIIIVNYKSLQFTKNAILSILRQNFNFEYEIVVVDNNSDDGCMEALRGIDKVKFVQAGANLGFSRGNNFGEENSSGDYLLFLNPDTELVDNSLALAIKKMEEDKTISATTGALFYDRGLTERQKNIKNNPTLCSQVLILLKLHHFFKYLPCLSKYLNLNFNYFREQEVKQVMGACMLFKREVFEKIGRFSQEYLLWWDEVDLCKKMQNKGCRIWYFPQFKVVHYEGKSFQAEYHKRQENILMRIKKRVRKQHRFNTAMLIYFRKFQPFWQYLFLASFYPISIILAILSEIFNIKSRDQGKL